MRISFPWLMAAFTFAALITVALSTVTGAVDIHLADALMLLSGSSDASAYPLESVVLYELRLPRIVMALLVGCILAQSGAILQGLFRNPLADPGIIGVSSGAAVGAIIAIVVLPEAWKTWSIPSFAFLAGLGTTFLVYALARSEKGTSVVILLLAGVAMSAFAGAAIGFMTYFADDNNLRELSVWQMGSLAKANPQELPLLVVVCIGLIVLFQRQTNALNALLLGESEARHMGIDVEALKRTSIILVAIGVGVSVAYSGIIGFVGLVVPHIVRMLCGPNHRFLLPLSALLGGLLLLISDLFARTIISPSELPIGLITSLIGAPFFIVLLLRERKRWY